MWLSSRSQISHREFCRGRISERRLKPNENSTTYILASATAGKGLLYDLIVASEKGAEAFIGGLRWHKDVKWTAHKALALTIHATPKRLAGPRLALPKSFPAAEPAAAQPTPRSKASRTKARARSQGTAEDNLTASPEGLHGRTDQPDDSVQTQNELLDADVDPWYEEACEYEEEIPAGWFSDPTPAPAQPSSSNPKTPRLHTRFSDNK